MEVVLDARALRVRMLYCELEWGIPIGGGLL